MRLKVTHYGEPNDPYKDSNSMNWIGNHDNILNISSCALTRSAQEALECDQGALLRIVFTNRLIMYRTFDDRAPESDPRLDLFNPFNCLPPGLPDYADVTVINIT